MLQTTFESIIQFRKHVGSIHVHTHTHTYTDGISCHGVCMLFACFCHIVDVQVMCWRAWWPEQPAAFPQRWHVHYALTTGTASVRGPVQPKAWLWQRLSLSLWRSPAPVSPGIISKKDFLRMFEFPLHNFDRCHGCSIHETCRRALETFNLLTFAFSARCCQAQPRANKMHSHVIL